MQAPKKRWPGSSHRAIPRWADKRIEHIAIAVKSMAEAREIFEDKVGLPFEYEEQLPQYSTRLAIFPVGQTHIELLNRIARTPRP